MQNGACLSCFPGYAVNANTGNCVVSSMDSNCKEFRPDGSCNKCAVKFYLNQNGKCAVVNPLCKDYNPNSGACTLCYPGYAVSGNTCIVGSNADPNCKTSDGSNCNACITGFYLQSNKCYQVSPLCKTFDQFSGACTSCYNGYDLVAANCVISTTKDKNCKSFDTANTNFCRQCYNGYIPLNGVCSVQNPLCRTVDFTNGACLTCWQGYAVSYPNCVLDQSSQSNSVSDPYCIKFGNTGCSQCANGYYLSSSSGQCTQEDPLCKTSDQTNGNCLSCYGGYTLRNTKCEVAQAVIIVNCNTINEFGVCVECLDGYYLANNECRQVPIECATYNRANGQCTSCIEKYFFQDGGCMYPGLWDDNCVRYESSYCSQCSNGYYLSSYTCKLIDPNCSSFNFQTLTCDRCSNNKFAQGPDCL